MINLFFNEFTFVFEVRSMLNIFANINYWNCRLKLKIVIKNVIFLFSTKTLSKVKSEKNEQIFTHNNIN